MKERNKVKKVIGAGMVVLCMVFAILFVAFCADASGETSSILYANRTYEKKDTAPKDIPTGYIFGGWYTAENDEDAVVTNPEVGKMYLAKFVPEEVLGIKAQISDTLLKDSTAQKSAIRFVTSVDSIKYKKVGFLIKKGTGEVKETNVTNVVYESLYTVTNENGTAGEKITTAFPSIFHVASKYFKTYTIKNVPDSAYNTDITVTPYWITLDGTRVEGTKSIKTVNLGRSWIYVNSTANADMEEYGTYQHPYTDLKQVIDAQTKARVILRSSMEINEPLTIADGSDIQVEAPSVQSTPIYTITGDALVESIFQVAENATLTVTKVQLSGAANAISSAGRLNLKSVVIDGSGAGLNLIGSSTCTADTLDIKNTSGRGIYMKGANTAMEVTSQLTISNAQGDAIEIDGTGNNQGNLTTTGATSAVIISTTASGKKGLFLNGGKASADIKNLYISNAGEHGIYINNAAGTLTSTGMIDITSPGSRGIYTRGIVKANNIAVKDTVSNAIEIDGSGTNQGNLTATGNVIIDKSASTMQGLYLNGANASADVNNLTINYAGANGIYINNAAGKLTATGTIKATYPGARGVYNNGGTIDAVHIVVENAENNYSAIQNVGTITAAGDVTVKHIKNAAGIRNQGTMTVKGTTTIADIYGTQNVNGIQQDGGKTMTLNKVIISDISQTASNPNSSGVCEHSNGIYNNKGTINLNGTATISNVKNPAAQTATETTEATGIVNFGTIQGTGSLNISDTGRDGIYNAVSSGSKGLIDLSGNIEISTVGKHGIHSKTGTINVPKVIVRDTTDIGIFMEVRAILEADTVTVDGAKSQAVQLNHDNTLTVGTMTLTNTPKNGLRLYNNSANPAVTIDKVIVKNCGECGVASAQALTDADLNIRLVQYRDCSTAAHSRITSGIGAKRELVEYEVQQGSSLYFGAITKEDALASIIYNSSKEAVGTISTGSLRLVESFGGDYGIYCYANSDANVQYVEISYDPQYEQYRTGMVKGAGDTITDQEVIDAFIQSWGIAKPASATKAVLSGKSALFVGDSITYGAKDTAKIYEYGGWAGRIGYFCNMNVLNNGVSGACVTTARVESHSTKHYIYNNLVAAKNQKFDYVIMHGLFNDASIPVELGTAQGKANFDPQKADASKFADALELLFYTAKTQHPEATLGYIINFKTERTVDQGPYADLALQICEDWGIKYLNLYHDDTFSVQFADGLHPTSLGYDSMYTKIADWMAGTQTQETAAKVMSYNVFWNCVDNVATDITISNRIQKVKNVITASNPDILMLQEVSGGSTGWTSQMVSYAKTNGYGYYGYSHKSNNYIDSIAGKNTTTSNDEMVPIFWKTEKYTCVARGHFWASDTPDVPASATYASIGVTCSYPRCINWVVLKNKVTGEQMIVVNYHAAPDKDGVTYENVRDLTAQLIVDQMAQLKKTYANAPIILGGDCNMQRTHTAYKTFTNNGYKDAKLVAAETTSRNSYNAWNREVSKFGVGDFLFGDEGIQFATYSVVDDLDPDGSGFYVSDHSPIIGNIKY